MNGNLYRFAALVISFLPALSVPSGVLRTITPYAGYNEFVVVLPLNFLRVLASHLGYNVLVAVLPSNGLQVSASHLG